MQPGTAPKPLALVLRCWPSMPKQLGSRRRCASWSARSIFATAHRPRMMLLSCRRRIARSPKRLNNSGSGPGSRQKRGAVAPSLANSRT